MNKLFAGMTIDDVVNKYSDTLIRVAYQNTKLLTDAEDIVQEVYIKLMKHSKGFVSDEHLKSWLIRVTINKCKDLFRLAWFKYTTPILDDMDFMAPEEQKLMEEIFQLKREDRTIIYLYYYEGYSIKEIAAIMSKKENTISSKLQRARSKLKIIIEEGRVGC